MLAAEVQGYFSWSPWKLRVKMKNAGIAYNSLDGKILSYLF